MLDIDGPTTLPLDGAGVGEGDGLAVEWEPALDWFPPAQFDDLDRTAKLSAPSYEEMVAGVRFAAVSVTVPGDAVLDVTTIEPGYEVSILDPERTRHLGQSPLRGPLASAVATLQLDAAHRSAVGRTVTAGARYDVRPARWVTIDATTGVALGGAGTRRDAMLARRSTLRGDRASAAASGWRRRALPAGAAPSASCKRIDAQRLGAAPTERSEGER